MASDNGSGSLSATKAVAITVTNVFEGHYFNSASPASFAENGTGTVYTVASTDVDAGTTLTYSLGGTDAAKFAINSGTGVVTFVTAPNYEAPTDSGANNVYNIDVMASDNGSGIGAVKSVAITVTNVNEAPVITSAATANFAENGTGTVYTVASTDVDAGTTLTYSLGGTDAAKFAINSGTGVVTFVTAPNFEAPTDSGANNVYNIEVMASDGSLTGTQSVAITVTNVNEAPVMASGLMTTSVFEVADAAASTSTAYTLLVGQTAQGNLTGAGDHDRYKVTLESGKTYSFAMLGTGVSNIIDPYLKLYNSSGNQVTTVDNNVVSGSGNGGSGFYSTYTATTSGVYYLDAAASISSHTGQYGIAFDLGGRPTLDVSMGAGAIDSDYAWSAGGNSATVTYGFRLSFPSDPFLGSNTATLITTQQMVAIKAALQFWQDVSGITFLEVNTSGSYTDSAAILFCNYDATGTGRSSFAYLPTTANSSGTSSQGDVWFNVASGEVSKTAFPYGGYSFQTMVHEIGHAIGLTHTGTYNGGNPTYANDAPYANDSNQYSEMSYFDPINTGANFGDVSPTTGRATTPMMFDILAAQNIYGANTATRATDTIYGFNSTAGSAYLFSGSTASSAFCIWDGAGTDTVDVSGFAQNQLINLGAGTFSDVGGLTANLSIAIGCSIENAKGGSGSDVIFGNSLNNTITGGAGNDMLFGGAGSDTAIFSSARSNYVISSITDGWSVVGTDGTDQLFNFEYAQFLDQTVTLAANSSFVITSYVKASFAENGTGTVYTTAATDVDAGTTLNYSLGGTDASLFNISSSGAVTFKVAPNYEAPSDAGANNVFNVTVTASDGVKASDAQEVAIAVTNVVDAGDAVIDLGAYGKLIAPVQVDGGQWFYYWDRSGNGTSANSGSLNGGSDSTTHNVLDAIFNKDINGVVGGGGNTTDTYRYATINGVHLALPTIGGSTGFPFGPLGISNSQPGTAVGGAPATAGSNAINTNYNDLLAIWDAYNGTTTSIATSGLPSGWNGGDYYWSATSSSGGHASLFLEGGGAGYVRPDLDANSRYVALQVS